MANEKRLIDAMQAVTKMSARVTPIIQLGANPTDVYNEVLQVLAEAPTVDAYSEEQVANLIQQTEKLEAKNKELEKEVSWQKSCLNCKIRKECSRHCGKVVHDCDHWEYGDSTVDAVEVVHERWKDGECTVCGFDIRDMIDGESEFRSWVWDGLAYCPDCGADMRERSEGE